MKPAQLIAIGIGIIFVTPVLLGLLVSHFFGTFVGAATGILWFVGVVAVGWRHMGKQANQQKNKEVK